MLKASDTTAPYSFSWDTLTATDGPHTLTAKAYDPSNNVGTSAGIAVTVANQQTGGGELLANGGFEGSAAPWVLSGNAYCSTGGYAHGGSGYTVLGYYNNASGTEYQTAAIPMTASGTLTFWLNVTSSETTANTVYDRLYVEVRSTAGVLLGTVATFSNLNKATAGVYTQRSFSLAAWKGQTVAPAVPCHDGRLARHELPRGRRVPPIGTALDAGGGGRPPGPSAPSRALTDAARGGKTRGFRFSKESWIAMSQPSRLVLVTALSALSLAATVAAQSPVPTGAAAVDEKAFKVDAPGLYANADLSYVLTSGNSSSSSLGFKGDVTRRFTRQSISFSAGGIRASSSPDVRIAVGTPSDFEVQIPEAEPTAEAYYGRGRYDYKLSERLYYTLGGGWERNRFSGIENRWVIDTGIGYIFLNNARTSFRGAAGITYTSEDYTVSSGQDGSFIGARVGWDFRQQLFSATTFSHSFIGDQSFEDSAARRFDAQFGVHVAMNARLGLKVNWRILYNNLPPSTEIPLLGPGGVPTGLTVLAPYKKTDQGLSVSLVFSVAPPKKG